MTNLKIVFIILAVILGLMIITFLICKCKKTNKKEKTKYIIPIEKQTTDGKIIYANQYAIKPIKYTKIEGTNNQYMKENDENNLIYTYNSEDGQLEILFTDEDS